MGLHVAVWNWILELLGMYPEHASLIRWNPNRRGEADDDVVQIRRRPDRWRQCFGTANCVEFNWVLPSFSEFERVFAGFDEFLRVFASLREFARVFASFCEFLRVFASFREFSRVLTSFGEFWASFRWVLGVFERVFPSLFDLFRVFPSVCGVCACDCAFFSFLVEVEVTSREFSGVFATFCELLWVFASFHKFLRVLVSEFIAKNEVSSCRRRGGQLLKMGG